MELHIQNFRGIESLDLSFCGALNETLNLSILAGENGTGKTAALEAVLLLLGQRALLRPDLPPLREQIRFGADSFTISGEVEVNRGPRTLMELVHLEVKSAQLDRPTPPGQTPGATQVDLLRRLAVKVEYFSARRRLILREGGPEVAADPSPESQRVLELRRRLLSLAGSGKGDAVLDRLQGMWRRFHGPGQRFDFLPTDNRPGAPLEVIVREDRPLPKDVTSVALARRMAPLRRDVPWMVPMLQLGSGDLALLSFAGPLLFPGPNPAAGAEARPDLVLIDEPEQGLHLSWQSTLIAALRGMAPQTQFIVATRSDEVLAATQSYEGFILLRPDCPASIDPVEPYSPLPAGLGRESFQHAGGRRQVMISRAPAPLPVDRRPPAA